MKDTDLDTELLYRLRASPELQSAHQQVMDLTNEQVKAELTRVLTPELIKFILGGHLWDIQDTLVQYKLRAVLTVARLLLAAETAAVTLRWFGHSNEMLSGLAPAEKLRDGRDLEAVVRAAAAYAEDGY